MGRRVARSLMGLLDTSRRPKEATPFVLAYGMKVIISTEISMPTTKIAMQDQMDNDEEIIKQLDWADKKWGVVAIWIASYHQRAIDKYNKRARPQFFQAGSLVLKKVFENTAKVGAKKLQANWEWPYVVIKATNSRAYHLQTLDGKPLLRPWNVTNLKQYYQ